jgi:dihydropyrimidinase
LLDLVIKNGKVVLPEGLFSFEIGTEDGLITKLARTIDEQTNRTIDASGKIVIPGVIDGHTHFEMPYTTPAGTFITSDDFLSGTIAAACGGCTTILDFVTPEPKQPLVESFKARKELAGRKAVIDYGFHVIVNSASESTHEQLEILQRDYGVTSFKVFTSYKKRGMMLNDGELIDILFKAASLGALILAHCENEEMINTNTSRLLSQQKIDPQYHALSRKDYVEAEAVQRIGFLSQLTGASVLVVHLSSARGLRMILDANATDAKLYAETCPHYLTFTNEVYQRKDAAKFLMSPPLKGKADLERLWEGIALGEISTVGSDHACFSLDQKMKPKIFTDIPGGVQGTENILCILLNGVAQGRITLEQLVKVTSFNPAKLYNLYPRKGTISPNADADLVILDPKKKMKLEAKYLHSNLDYSIYEDISVEGYPVATIARGVLVFEDGQFVGEHTKGNYVFRRAAGPARVNPHIGC